MIHADPRYTRTSAVSDMYLRIRTGTDVAFFGGLINYVIENKLIHEEYVKNYTNASFVIKEGFDFKDGLFSGYDAGSARTTSRRGHTRGRARPGRVRAGQKEIAAAVEGPPRELGLLAKRDMTLQDPRSVFQLIKTTRATRPRWCLDHRHPEGAVPRGRQDRRRDGEAGEGHDHRVRRWPHASHHWRSAHPLGCDAQLLLGNMGRPGGGMNAERGHANIQGNTDHAISWENLPGYLRIPAPGQKNLDDYVRISRPRSSTRTRGTSSARTTATSWSAC